GQRILADRDAVIAGRARLVAARERVVAQRLCTVTQRGADLARGLGARTEGAGTRHGLSADQDRVAVLIVDRRVVLVVGLAHSADGDAAVPVRAAVLAHGDRIRTDRIGAAAIGRCAVADGVGRFARCRGVDALD